MNFDSRGAGVGAQRGPRMVSGLIGKRRRAGEFFNARTA